MECKIFRKRTCQAGTKLDRWHKLWLNIGKRLHVTNRNLLREVNHEASCIAGGVAGWQLMPCRAQGIRSSNSTRQS